MEGTHRHISGGLADHLVQAIAHLGGGLVGEGHGKDLPRGDTLVLDQPGDAVRDHPRLPRAGTREHEQWAGSRGHRASLRLVQRSEDALLNGGAGGLPKGVLGRRGALRRGGIVGRIKGEVHPYILPPATIHPRKTKRTLGPAESPLH